MDDDDVMDMWLEEEDDAFENEMFNHPKRKEQQNGGQEYASL